jgi:hypothetical protein
MKRNMATCSQHGSLQSQQNAWNKI